jgi:hypothetical protein
MGILWKVQDGKLVAAESTGRVLWTGRLDNTAPRTVLAVEGGEDCIVLLRYEDSDAHPFANVLRVTPSGGVTWRAALPSDEPNDAYVSVSRAPDGLVANSWSGYRVRLDESSGQILERVFTK